MSCYQLHDGRWVVQHRDPDRPGKYKREYFSRGLEGEKQARHRNEGLGFGSYTRRKDPSGDIHFSSKTR